MQVRDPLDDPGEQHDPVPDRRRPLAGLVNRAPAADAPRQVAPFDPVHDQEALDSIGRAPTAVVVDLHQRRVIPTPLERVDLALEPEQRLLVVAASEADELDAEGLVVVARAPGIDRADAAVGDLPADPVRSLRASRRSGPPSAGGNPPGTSASRRRAGRPPSWRGPSPRTRATRTSAEGRAGRGRGSGTHRGRRRRTGSGCCSSTKPSNGG